MNTLIFLIYIWSDMIYVCFLWDEIKMKDLWVIRSTMTKSNHFRDKQDDQSKFLLTSSLVEAVVLIPNLGENQPVKLVRLIVWRYGLFVGSLALSQKRSIESGMVAHQNRVSEAQTVTNLSSNLSCRQKIYDQDQLNITQNKV